jgi:PAS domain S-box-containing protein
MEKNIKLITKLKKKLSIGKINSLGIFKSVVDTSSNGVVVINSSGVVLYVNSIALKMAGLKERDILDQNHKDTLRFVSAKSGRPLNSSIDGVIASGKAKKSLSKNSVLMKDDGKTVFIDISVVPLKDKDKIWGASLIFRDITNEKEIEKAKTEFVSLASHQLRTPLATVNWYAEMMLNGDAGKVTTEQKKYIQEIYHGNQRMIELVNDLLNVSRIDLGTIIIAPEPVNFKEVAESVFSELYPQIKNKKIKIKKAYGKVVPDIVLDPKLARIICQNLLSNAIKYTPESGTVSLTIKKSTGKLLLTVADTGIGIPKNQQKDIFSRLFRAENAKEKLTEGTGLGLYIVKLAVEKFNGKIWFDSTLGEGTTFYVDIPLQGMKKGVTMKKLIPTSK